jgi:septum formation protein
MSDSHRRPQSDPESALILASTSPYRRALLERLGVPFCCRAPRCDESAIQRQEAEAGTAPRLLAEKLALAKATSLIADEPGAAIIGCDQLVAFEGHVFGKPETLARAVDQLAADRPLDCAGSYKLEARGIVLFDRIESDDHTAITGLPMIALVSILRELGFVIP